MKQEKSLQRTLRPGDLVAFNAGRGVSDGVVVENIGGICKVRTPAGKVVTRPECNLKLKGK